MAPMGMAKSLPDIMDAEGGKPVSRKLGYDATHLGKMRRAGTCSGNALARVAGYYGDEVDLYQTLREMLPQEYEEGQRRRAERDEAVSA